MDELISFLTHQGDTIRVRVVHHGTPNLSREQRVRGRLAARELRIGIDWRHPASLLAAERLFHALRQSVPLFQPGSIASTGASEGRLRELVGQLEREFQVGRLLVEDGANPALGVPPEFELTQKRPPPAPEPPAPPPPTPLATDEFTFFDVRFVDEVGQPIGGLDVEFDIAGRAETITTNPAGVALLEDVKGASASVGIVSIADLEAILDPRWDEVRPGQLPTGQNTKSFQLTGTDIAGIGVKSVVPNTVVITPPLGRLFVELWDKTGRVRHSETSYQITGPASFAGKTDAQGRLRHEDVLAGDYTLTFEVEGDVQKTALVALAAGGSEPEVRFLGAVPRVVMARIKKFVFETNKSFLMPDGVRSLQAVAELYDNEQPAKLLIVGHTDTTAQPSINDPLSLERANNTKAYLLDDVDTWLAMFETSVPTGRRWGANEDTLMIEAMPDFRTKSPEEESVRWFQRTRSLEVDGICGPNTRRQLITEYMNADGTSLKQPREFDIEITTHGCGENFPLDESGEELDEAPEDQKEDAADRRVELFFFDAEFGILPPPPGDNSGPGSTEYPKWRDSAVDIIDLEAPDRRQLVLEWPELLTQHVPPELVLRVDAERTFEVPWSKGRVEGDMRKFVISGFDDPRCSLTAVSPDGELELWVDQPVDDPENPPVWKHLLEEILIRVEDEPTGEDREALTDEQSHALRDFG